jgi:isopentenyl-diphosphate Delta-isomerase
MNDDVTTKGPVTAGEPSTTSAAEPRAARAPRQVNRAPKEKGTAAPAEASSGAPQETSHQQHAAATQNQTPAQAPQSSQPQQAQQQEGQGQQNIQNSDQNRSQEQRPRHHHQGPNNNQRRPFHQNQGGGRPGPGQNFKKHGGGPRQDRFQNNHPHNNQNNNRRPFHGRKNHHGDEMNYNGGMSAPLFFEDNQHRAELPKRGLPESEKRKNQHMELMERSQVAEVLRDERFYYEPMMAAHPENALQSWDIPFAGKILKAPLWISSMTGGSSKAGPVNMNLAKAAKKFGLGMGLGSCRSLLESEEHLGDFDLREFSGSDVPVLANLGLAQIEDLVAKKELKRLRELIELVHADGLIVHVNPLQEWFQPEGERYRKAPLDTLKALLKASDYPVVVKEVGQGFGPQSLKALLQMPFEAIDFAAFGGTNFSQLEIHRQKMNPTQKTKAPRINPITQMLEDDDEDYNPHEIFSEEPLFSKEDHWPLTRVGQTNEEMIRLTADLLKQLKTKAKVKTFIISGGVKSFLDGYYYCELLKTLAPQVNCFYGQAGSFLKRAQRNYDELESYTRAQIHGLTMAKNYLTLRESYESGK